MFDILGDPHLGRQFIHGVPLARKGEREGMVWTAFTNNIMNPRTKLHICMGDLFDKAIVSYDVIRMIADRYLAAAEANPSVTYVILKGNHDWIRDLERIAAFDLLQRILGGHSQFRFVTDYATIEGMGFFAWQPITKANEMVEKLEPGVETVFGHWDIESFGGSDDNLIPTAELAKKGVKTAHTGHIHKPQRFDRDGVDVVVTGSMQPYAHGEEANDDLYITLTLSELGKHIKPLVNKCVRVILESDEVLDYEVNCLQLTVKKLASEDDTIPEVEIGDFNMEKLFREAFAAAKVSDSVTEAVFHQYNTARLVDGV